jgi:hypothetical protein
LGRLHSIAKFFANWIRAALEALYTGDFIPLLATSPDMLAIKQMLPPHLYLIIIFAADDAVSNTAVKLIASSLLASWAEYSMAGVT